MIERCVCLAIGVVQIELNLLFFMSVTFGFGDMEIWNQLFIKFHILDSIILTKIMLFYSFFLRWITAYYSLTISHFWRPTFASIEVNSPFILYNLGHIFPVLEKKA